MTKAEFISKIEVWRKRQARNQYIFFGTLAVLFVLWLVLSRFYDHSEPGSPARITWSGVPFLIFIVVYFGQKLVLRHTFKRYGVSCPVCTKPLGGLESIAIATGHCGSCGKRILDDDPSDPAAP